MIIRTYKYVALALCLIFMCCMGGVYAVWTYLGHANAIESEKGVIVSEFGFKVEEVVPGGGGEIDDSNVEVGQNHYNMIDSIVNNLKYGLNTTGNQPIIHNKLTYDGAVLYCEDNVQGGNLKAFFVGVADNAEKVFFVIHRESATEYQIYTMLDSDLDKGVGTRIEVYKTLAEKKDGKWESTISYKGTAQINRPGTKTAYGIDVHTFVQG